MKHGYSFLLVCCCVLATARPVLGQATPADAAKGAELFKKAQVAAKTTDPVKLEGACTMYADSQKLAPSITTQLAFADCRERQGRWFEAYTEYEAATIAAIQAKDAKREKLATDKAAALVPKLVRVTLRVASPNAPGLEIWIGENKLAYHAWSRVNVVAPGPVLVVAAAPQYLQFRTERSAAAGEEVVVDVPALVLLQQPVAPVYVPPAPVTQAQPSEVEVSMKKAKRLMIIGGITFGVSCLLALHASSRYEDAVDELDVDEVNSAQLQADLATLVGVTGIVISGIGYMKYRKAKRDRGVVLAPTITPTAAGAVLMGRF